MSLGGLDDFRNISQTNVEFRNFTFKDQRMKTVTVDILDDKAINLLKDLEGLRVIKLHEEDGRNQVVKSVKDLKGQMTRQSIEEIDKQLNDLRNEWD